MASKRGCDQLNISVLLESLFTVSDPALIDASIGVLLESRSTDSHQNDDFIQHAIHLSSVLLEAVKRSACKRSSVHNASVWPLSRDLTIKVFTMLDTPSICYAAATCSFFHECGVDPLCYTNIDLATLVPKVKDDAVSTVIQRAGNRLWSIKLGILPPDSDEQLGERNESPILTRSCLSYLSANGGAYGSCLRRLHLYSIGIDDRALWETLSVCSLLIDLEIVQLKVNINDTLESVSGHCRLIERFIYESNGKDYPLQMSVCKEFVVNCPKIATLALKASEVSDSHAFELVKGFQELKHVDFSDAFPMSFDDVFTGAFLKNLGGANNNLETMILRDCSQLKISAVERFIEALVAGEMRLLRHLDISDAYNLGDFLAKASILIKQLLEQRPNFCFVAECYFYGICTSDDNSYHDNTSDSSSSCNTSSVSKEEDDREESSSSYSVSEEDESEESDSISAASEESCDEVDDG